jgi:hypothetical protein
MTLPGDGATDPRSARGRRWRWLGLAVVAVLLTRAPSFRYGPISDDEAIYDTMAREVVAGGVEYRDTVDHKPPGLVHAYAAVRALTGDRGAWPAVHLLGMLAALGTVCALAGVAGRLLDARLAVWPPLLYALGSAAQQPVDALAVNGELLMNLPCTLAVWLALATGERGRQAGLDLAVGALIGVAALFKYQAAALGFAFLFLVARRAPWRPVLWLAGALVPVALAAAWFAHRGALADAIRWGISFNGRYVAQGPSLVFALARLGVSLVAVVLPAGVLFGAAGANLVRMASAPFDGIGRERPFLLAWTLGAAACVALGGRFFGHYFLQLELPLAVLAASGVDRLWRWRPRLTGVAVVAPALLFATVAAFPALAVRAFDPGLPDYARIAEGVAARTSAAESIWVWGNAPLIYAEAQRRAGGRFVFCNYITGLSPATPSEYDPDVDAAAAAVPGALALALEDLDRRRPALFLDTAAARLKGYGKFPLRRYPELAAYVALHYRRDGEAGGVPVYRRTER